MPSDREGGWDRTRDRGRDSENRRRGASSSRHDEDEGRRRRYEPGSRNYDAPRRRSRSPRNFEADRARERESYYARHTSSSPPPRRHRSNGRSEDRKESEGQEDQGGEAEAGPSSAPDFSSSGLLAAESNSKAGVALKYHEPPEARKPRRKWRLYVFKHGREVDVLHISRQSAYLFGRDHTVADVPIDHPSASKQHAVIQYRNIIERNEFGDEKRTIKPFLIDLDSANGCTVNGTEVPASRYYELRNGDTMRIGASSREYVLLAED